MKETVGKILYGGLFVIVLPGLLALWTSRTESGVTLPAIHSAPWGVGIAGIGLALVLAGIIALCKIGGGLPMNAYPPPNYVSQGIYGFVSHPSMSGLSSSA
jgi:protein-S-isoprenylcysteine O-methyltransferase Ste14